MRHIAQPGPVATERIQWVEARGQPLTLELRAGKLLLDAVEEAFSAAGFTSGVLNMKAGALGPFAYVLPALAPTPEYAAFYSEAFRPNGTSQIDCGAMTFGSRDGKPFFHSHALWTEADGKRMGGHILPEETRIAQTFSVEALGISGAAFEARPDPETGFKLFGPIACAHTTKTADRRVFALRLRPNQDLAGALEQFCVSKQIARARIHGGVGSIIGATFADGRIIDPFATEMAIKSGTIDCNSPRGSATSLDIALIDYTGGMAQGVLKNGCNPVLITVELVIEEG